jgi:hypothetical protein
MHGGLTPRGAASPHFKHGRYSRALPARLLERYQSALDDPDLLAMHHEIGVVDARLHELIGRIDTGESGARWKAIRRALQDYRDARGTMGEETSLGVLAEAIEAGVSDEAAWREISGLIGQRQALVESERRRLVQTRQMISVEEATATFVAVLDAVHRHIHDRDTLAAIGREFERIVRLPERTAPSSAPVPADVPLR